MEVCGRGEEMLAERENRFMELNMPRHIGCSDNDDDDNDDGILKK